MEFEIGQIFAGEYPPEVAHWCNERGNCFIEEIETIDGVRRFEIKEPSEDLLKQREIAEIKSKLNEIDLKCIRALRAGDSEYLETYETQALELRTRLAELE
ncbi:MAG: hypothetical protein NC390_07300 [Fusobacterium sp.]|nr:hypothetical protein [Fusobacterium sp.]